MKRLAIILAAVIVLVSGVLVAAPLFIPADVAREQIAAQIEQWIGRPVSFAGEPAISFFPRPSVRLDDVVIEDAWGNGDAFIRVDELTGSFRILPLLVGRLEASSFELVRPTIALIVDDEGRSNWTFDGTLGQRVAEAQADVEANERDVSLGRFRIVDGTITYLEPGAELATISEVTLDLAWASTNAAATASGSLVWRGQRVAISAELSEPLELIAGRPSPGSFTANGDLIRIAFDGTVARNDLDFVFDGETNMTMGSLRQVIEWAGAEIGEGETLEAASINGEARWEWPILAFPDIAMRIDGNRASGGFTVDFSGERIGIVGTLALEDLDLTRYAEIFRADMAAAEDWREVPIHLPLFDHINADIRISAERLRIGATHLENVAASAIVDDGRITLQIADADFYGGRLHASLSGVYRATLFEIEIAAEMTGVDCRLALTDIVGVAPVEGELDATLALHAAADRWGLLVEALFGEAEATISDGVLVGVDMSGAATAPQPTIEDVVFGSGRTPFETAVLSLTTSDGRVVASPGTIEGERFIVAFNAFGALTGTDIGGEGTLSLIRSGEEIIAVPFIVTGKWLEPQFGTTQ